MNSNPICHNKDCTGCSACQNICPQNAIHMLPKEHGFLEPSIDAKLCVDCKLCEYICPSNIEKEYGHPIQKVFAAWTSNKKQRALASSGGIFGLLACSIIMRGGSVAGVRWNEQLEAEHILVNDIESLEEFFGSKYVQSNVKDIYKQIESKLNDGIPVLFSGTPCQNAALKSYLGHEYNNLYMIDIVCHGVPSNDILKKYLSQQEINGKQITKLFFRYKKRYQDYFYIKKVYKDGLEVNDLAVNNPYYQLFNVGYTLRPSCHKCKYTSLNRQGDITLADYWGFIPKNAKMRDFNKGVSLVAINTDKGNYLFNNIKSNCIFEESSISLAVTGNKCFREPYYIEQEKLDSFWKDYDENMSFNMLMKKYIPEPSKMPKNIGLLRFKKKYRWLFK